MYLNTHTITCRHPFYKVEPKHRMYLNLVADHYMARGIEVEPKHRMYLNIILFTSMVDGIKVEPKHRMYLNR